MLTLSVESRPSGRPELRCDCRRCRLVWFALVLYGNLTPCVSTLWVRVKRHAIHQCLYSLCTEDTWKVTARSHGRLVENTLLIAEGILYVTILCHNILLVFGLIVSDIRVMSLISVDQWLWYMDQFYILFWIRLESGTAYCLNWRYLHWFDIEIISCVHDAPGHGVLWSSFSPSDENTA